MGKVSTVDRILADAVDTVASLGSNVALKSAFAALAAGAAWLFGSERGASMLLALLALTVLDMVTGVIASHMRGHPIESARLGRTVGKVLAYMAFAISVSVAAKATQMPPEAMSVVLTGVIGYLSATEFLSIVENCDRMGILPPGVRKLLEPLTKGKSGRNEDSDGTQL